MKLSGLNHITPLSISLALNSFNPRESVFPLERNRHISRNNSQDGNMYQQRNNDARDYGRGYNIFLKHNNFRKAVVSKLAQKLKKDKDLSQGKIDILDVGCGNGEMTVQYLNLFKTGNNISITLVEPASSAVDIAKQLIASQFPDVSTQTFQQTLEEYLNFSGEVEFDFIIASYVFYHLPPQYIISLLEKLKTGGKLVIAMGSAGHPLRKIPGLPQDQKHADYEGLNNVIRKIDANPEYEVLELDVNTTTSLNGLFENQEITPEGKSYFSFLYNTNFDDFNNEQVKNLCEYLRSVFDSKNGKIHHNHKIYILQKK